MISYHILLHRVQGLVILLFDSGLSTLLMTGKIFSHKFTRAGEFPYFCLLHAPMIGAVIVA